AHAAESAARSPSPRGRRTAENSAQAQTHSQARTTSSWLTRRAVVEAASTEGPRGFSLTRSQSTGSRRCQTPPRGFEVSGAPEGVNHLRRAFGGRDEAEAPGTAPGLPPSDLEEEPLRVLDALLDPDQELHCLAPVDETVVVAQG